MKRAAITLALLLMLGLLLAGAAPAQTPPTPVPAPSSLPTLPDVTLAEVGGQSVSVPLQILALMTVITLLPGMLLAMTAFTRIIVVLALLRQALGTGQTPSNQILLALALFITALVMMPVIDAAWAQGIRPYLDGQLGFEAALAATLVPVREFMFAQVREADLMLFAGLSGDASYASPDDVPFPVLMASFLTSELKTAFQIGFFLFVPFVIIDLVIASVLMSMGMMMLSPMLISAPFKILLFVLVDGWSLVVGTLAASFVTT
jgi:flagellar biosynthesis protein FliP